MDGLLCAINSIYYSTINDINFNMSNKEITFKLTLTDNENISNHTMQFKNVMSFLWIEKPKDSQAYSFSDCDYYELTSITFEKIDTKTEDDWLNRYLMEYNVVIEIWETALLINATELLIDNQLFSIPNSQS